MVVKKISFEFLKFSFSRVMRSSQSQRGCRRRASRSVGEVAGATAATGRGSRRRRGGAAAATRRRPVATPAATGRQGRRAGGAGRSAGRGVDEVVGEVGLFGAVDLATVVSV